MPQFPLLSKCMLLQALCADSGDSGGDAIELPGFPGGAEAFEACAKFCYGIAVTVGAHNVVPLRCAVARLRVTEAADRGNLGAKLDAFLASCLLRRWSDALCATARYACMRATSPSSASSSSGASWWLLNVAKRPSAWTGWSRWRP